ncbi:MAG: DinB family protein [Chloroflexota bacterium]|nr:DinB family protein [Chloroflexota bacterium]
MQMSMGATSLGQVRERHVGAMRLTCEILDHIARGISEEQAHELRDGPDGWSIVEIVCHLRDFDAIFRSRAQMMLSEDRPRLPAYDHEGMALERAYQQERLSSACQQLKASRRATIAFFASLTPEQWARDGVHPERDSFTMTDAVMQVGLHDLDHLEQITRILAG